MSSRTCQGPFQHARSGPCGETHGRLCWGECWWRDVPPGGAATAPPPSAAARSAPGSRGGTRESAGSLGRVSPAAGGWSQQLGRVGSGTGPEQRSPAFGAVAPAGKMVTARRRGRGRPGWRGRRGPAVPSRVAAGGGRATGASAPQRGHGGGWCSRPVRPGAAPTCGRGDAPPRKCAPGPAVAETLPLGDERASAAAVPADSCPCDRSR